MAGDLPAGHCVAMVTLSAQRESTPTGTRRPLTPYSLGFFFLWATPVRGPMFPWLACVCYRRSRIPGCAFGPRPHAVKNSRTHGGKFPTLCPCHLRHRGSTRAHAGHSFFLSFTRPPHVHARVGVQYARQRSRPRAHTLGQEPTAKRPRPGAQGQKPRAKSPGPSAAPQAITPSPHPDVPPSPPPHAPTALPYSSELSRPSVRPAKKRCPPQALMSVN